MEFHVAAPGNPTPAHPTQRHKEAEQFQNHVRYGLGQHLHRGINGSGQEANVVCKTALTEYWSRGRITDVLARDCNTHVHVEVIENECLKVFSILCYISCSHHFNRFTSALKLIDLGLPISEVDSRHYFATDPPPTRAELLDTLRRFCEAQWLFVPLDFEPAVHMKVLTPDHILPVAFNKMTPLATNDESAVYKVSFDPCCLGDKFKREANSIDIVFKMLSPAESWQNEVDAYNLLALKTPNEGRVHRDLTHMGSSVTVASSFTYITRYLGSFRFSHSPRPHGEGCAAQLAAQPCSLQSPAEPNHVDQYGSFLSPVTRDILEKSHVIVLEYARGGNLSQFCQRHIARVMSPDKEHRLNFWYQMFHLLQALHVIHSENG
jgi:hypothetical protein